MELNELSLMEALEGLKNNTFTSKELVEACFKQIEKYNPKLNAFMSLNKENALIEADLADKEIASSGSEAYKDRPLLGIPYACKDNFNTYGIQTTASSNILNGYIPPYESTVTQRLKDAGAVLLGKTNMDAFAHGSSNETSDFGNVLNPWNINRVPGGSSGGSAVAVSSNMCMFAIGSETAGSIRGPAAWTGLVGLKPTYGRVSRYGVIAMASSTDSPGPLTKNVEDAAYILGIIAGEDPLDATTSASPVDNYLANINEVSLKELKIGKVTNYFVDDIESGVKTSVENAIADLASYGSQIENIELLDPKYSIAVYTILQRSEVSSNLARFDGNRFGHTRDKFGDEAKKRIMLGTYALSSGYYDQYYAKAQKVRTLIVKDFEKAFEKVDVLVAPTMPTVALKFGEMEKTPIFGELVDVLNEASAIAGLTAISVPCGHVDGLPVGMQFIAPQLHERKLLSIAKSYMEHSKNFVKFPKLEETLK